MSHGQVSLQFDIDEDGVHGALRASGDWKDPVRRQLQRQVQQRLADVVHVSTDQGGQ